MKKLYLLLMMVVIGCGEVQTAPTSTTHNVPAGVKIKMMDYYDSEYPKDVEERVQAFVNHHKNNIKVIKIVMNRSEGGWLRSAEIYYTIE